MSASRALTVALVGNPNAGKSTLFNKLTGLRQKVGNFPGVTVERKSGSFSLPNGQDVQLVDLPGTYSLYPKSLDERVVFEVLLNTAAADYPDVVVVVCDASNLKRNLLLFTQVADLGLPTILVLNQIDVASRRGITIDQQVLAKSLGVPVVKVNSRNGEGIDQLLHYIQGQPTPRSRALFDTSSFAPALVTEVQQHFRLGNAYRTFHLVQQAQLVTHLNNEKKAWLLAAIERYGFNGQSFQAAETIARYSVISKLVATAVSQTQAQRSAYTQTLDNLFVHRFWGFGIFLGILFLLFQAIYSWASGPMDLIDAGIAWLSDTLKATLPAGPATDLLTDGVLAGLAGVLTFVPQIAILFAFISVLEETGYMARVVFIMDRLMRRFGLNGKSVVPLISGVACAVPAIMATRGIDNVRDRLVSIFVTPLVSCSARLPVFTVLIALVIPNKPWLGIFNLQGLALMGLYLLGFLAAIVSALVMSTVLRRRGQQLDTSFFVLELPPYKVPKWTNVGYSIMNSVKSFVLEAGKIIVAISIVLWVLASYGPGDNMEQAAEQARVAYEAGALNAPSVEMAMQGAQLEASYAGMIGHAIEPAIRPLGFDWKIGIALVTSFAAREVFIGTMSTIYSLGNDSENTDGVLARMQAEVNPDTGGPMFTPALACSLLVFYLFAMQCMSTLAVTYRETQSWKWPVAQLFYMTGLAYLCSWLVYMAMR